MKKILLFILFCCSLVVPAQQRYVVDLHVGYSKPDQYAYLSYIPLKKAQKPKRFVDCFSQSHLNSIYCVPIKIGATDSLYVYVVLDTIKREKYIAVDIDRNGTFSDKEKYVFKFSDYDLTERPQPLIALSYQCDTIFFNLEPFESHYSRDSYSKWDYYLQAALIGRGIQYGVWHFNDQSIELIRHCGDNRSLAVDESYGRTPFDIRHETMKNYAVSEGQTFFLQGRKMCMDSVQNGKLCIVDISAYSDSNTVGSTLPYFTATDTKTHKQVDIRTFIKGKYALLDFWGSWCAPCVASLPQMVELNEKIKNRSDVVIVGLALERPNELEKMNEVIKRLKIEYPNYYTPWDARNIPPAASWVLKIQKYPTYIIVDKKGTVAYVGSDHKEVLSLFVKMIDRIE